MGISNKLPGYKTLLSLYKGMLKSRLIEEKMLLLLRKNQISKWFSGIGQEAISVGVTKALRDEDYILPMHRNLGVFTERDVPLEQLFTQLSGGSNGFTKGRDRSFHFGSVKHHLVGMISHLGAQLPVACGIALGLKTQNKEQIVLAFTGDGGTSEGDFHEALNLAATWDLPVIFLIENNGYSISTPTDQQFKEQNLYLRGAGYGIQSIQIDGNNAIEVFETIKKIRKNILKKPRPYLIEAKTFRIRGHEESSGTDYVPQDEIDKWTAKDPLKRLHSILSNHSQFSQKELDKIETSINKEISIALKNSTQKDPKAITSSETDDVYAPVEDDFITSENDNSHIRYLDAIQNAQDIALETYPELLLMGQDIAAYGGVFKATTGLHAKHGDRVKNTPVCESAIIGASYGLSIVGMRSIVEMQFADFASCGFNQIVNNLAKSHYRWGQNANTVIRLPYGAGNSSGPFHSQSVESYFYGVAGLKMVFPSTPEDAKGLLLAAVKDPNPVLFFEHKGLYRSTTGPVKNGYFETPIGKGRLVTEGHRLSIITYGQCVEWATEVSEDVDGLEIIDLRSLMPWDQEMVFSSVKKTGKALLLTEDSLTGSIINDIASAIHQECFSWLDGPVKTVGSLDTPIPFNSILEEQYLSKSKLKKEVINLLDY